MAHKTVFADLPTRLRPDSHVPGMHHSFTPSGPTLLLFLRHILVSRIARISQSDHGMRSLRSLRQLASDTGSRTSSSSERVQGAPLTAADARRAADDLHIQVQVDVAESHVPSRASQARRGTTTVSARTPLLAAAAEMPGDGDDVFA